MYILNSSLIITDTVAGDLQTIVTAYFFCKPLTMFALYCSAVNNIYDSRLMRYVHTNHTTLSINQHLLTQRLLNVCDDGPTFIRYWFSVYCFDQTAHTIIV